MSQVDSNTERKQGEHLNRRERNIIEQRRREGASIGKIARGLGRDVSTIKREIKRGCIVQIKRNPTISKKVNVPEYIEYKVYFADVGQRRYEKNRLNSGNKNKIISCAEMVRYVEGKVLGAEKWSPDVAIGYARANKLFRGQFCTKTFYNWIDDGLVKVKNIDLLLKVRRRANRPRRERKKHLGKSIDERPSSVDFREEFGHWEGDGIVGKRQKGHLITLVERKSRVGMIFNAKTRESSKIVELLDRLECCYGKYFGRVFKSATFDNGSEFSDSAGIENRGRTTAYYAHPYSSFERGTNENWNGIVRRFLPKGSSFDSLDDEDLLRIAHYINTMPRKRLGYKTPMDIWRKEMDTITAA